MKVIIEIPDKDIPKQQELMSVNLTFMNGILCECSYPYTVLPKGHGDLIDRDDLLADSYPIDDYAGNEVNIIDVMTVKMADTIIEAERA